MTALLDRFCRYARVETTAVEDTDHYPSSPGQLELGRLLADELRALGLPDVHVSEFGIVTATIPPTAPGAPAIAWLAHMDTSPEYSGKNVRPQVHAHYDGRDLVLPGDPSKVIRVADTPALAACKGKTLITSDGTTLLGADDKAGLAIILTAAEQLLADKSPRGPVRIVFTCDEEVGRGVDKVDIPQLGAVCAYTLDGEAPPELENETFSADQAIVTLTGVNIHPGLAYGKMLNALRLAAIFLERMPKEMSPERTTGRTGFLHPYIIDGGVPEVRIKILLRSFVTAELAQQAEILRRIATAMQAEFPPAQVRVDVKTQYRNMKEYLDKEPRAVALAAEAYRRVGVTPQFRAIRGGTDGSRLSERGLPTPNLFAGMHNFHSPLEYAVLEEMELAVRTLVELAKLWGQEK